MKQTLIGVILAVTAILPAAAAAQIPPFVDIAHMPLGDAPLGFMIARTGDGTFGNWRVIEERTALGRRAIAEFGRGSPFRPEGAYQRLSLATYRPVAAADVEAITRFKPISGAASRAEGVAVRVTSSGDYYAAYADTLGGNVRLYRVTDGRSRLIDGADIAVMPGRWHTLVLRAEGNRFFVFLDGRQLFLTEDDTYSDAGQVALCTQGDGLTLFDWLEIRVAPLTNRRPS